MSHWFEGLEDRRLLSATLVGRVLTITGTDGPDRVGVLEVGTKVVVTESTFTPGTATEPPHITTTRSVFDRSAVDSVSADLKGGAVIKTIARQPYEGNEARYFLVPHIATTLSFLVVVTYRRIHEMQDGQIINSHARAGRGT